MVSHRAPVLKWNISNETCLARTALPRAFVLRSPPRPPIPRQVTAAADAVKVAGVLQSDRFKEALSPLRAECEPAAEGSGLKIVVVSKAFEGKSAKRREKLVLQALQEDEPHSLTIMAMMPGESAAMLKKWC